MSEPLQIRVPLSNGDTLVAESGNDTLYKEIFVGIEKEDGCWIDLAVIGEGYRYPCKEYGDEARYSLPAVLPEVGEYTIKVFNPQDDCDMITEVTVYDKEI